MTDIESGRVAAQRKERQSFVERKSLINWVGNWLDGTTCSWMPHKWHQKTIKARVSVNYRTCQTWLLVYLCPPLILYQSLNSQMQNITQKDMLFVQLHRDLCQCVVKIRNIWQKSLCHFLFTWGTQAAIYDETNQIKMLHLAINMLVLSKHPDFIWSRQDAVIKGNSVALSILQGRFKECTCCRKKEIMQEQRPK